MLQKIKEWWQREWTKAWSFIQSLLGLVTTLIGTAYADPNVSAEVHSFFSTIKWGGLVLVVLAIITFLSAPHGPKQ